MCSVIACSISSKVGWMGPGVLTTIRPPGASTRRISARAPARFSMNIRPIWHRTTSVVASGRGSAAASATCHSMGAPEDGVAVATSIMSGATSTPVTVPVGPTCSAASRVTAPVPQAMSATRSPARSPAVRSRSPETGVAMAGTK